MSDYPFKVGDLVQIKASHVRDRRPGIIVSIDSETNMFDILVEGTVHTVHANYVVVPKVANIKMTGRFK